MFSQLAIALGVVFPDPRDAANAVLCNYRPSEISEYLEGLWSHARNPALQLVLTRIAQDPNHRAMARPDNRLVDPLPAGAITPPPPLPPAAHWQHIVFAYMLENTRMLSIFRRVVYEWLHGEHLPTPTPPTQRWLHTTEQLFFAQPWPYSVRAVTSTIRPDAGAVRRNAYYRLLGMDLNHGNDDGTAYPYTKPEIANKDFAALFEALLAEVWRGYANRLTIVAENRTDDVAILNLVRRIREMLQSRRLAGTLSREEFDSVAICSWFRLALLYDTHVVADLSARAFGTADRLKKIGERVGLPAHSRADSYFQLAVPMSTVLLAIENDSIVQASDLYAGAFMNDMLQIITHWSIATGRDVKDISTRPTTGAVLAASGTGQAGLSLPPNGRAMVGVR